MYKVELSPYRFDNALAGFSKGRNRAPITASEQQCKQQAQESE